MVFSFLIWMKDFIFRKIELLASQKFWIIKASAIIFILSIFVSFPRLEIFSYDYNKNKPYLAEKLQKPFCPLDNPSDQDSHPEKLTFRIIVPLIACAFSLNILQTRILEFLMGLLLIYLSLKLFERLTKDKVCAFLGSLLLASVYICNGAFIEYRCFYDIFGFCFLAAAIYFRNPFLIFSCVFLAAWNDERALIASSFVFMFHFFNKTGLENKTKVFKAFLQKENLAVLLAWIAYLSLRILMTIVWDLKTDTDDITITKRINNFPLSLWTALEGGWLLVILAFIALILKKRYLLFCSGIAFITISAVVAISVIDVSRSMAYLLPVIFVSARILYETESIDKLRNYFLVAALAALLFPNFYVKSQNEVWWFSPPMPFQIARHFLLKN